MSEYGGGGLVTGEGSGVAWLRDFPVERAGAECRPGVGGLSGCDYRCGNVS